MLLQDEDGGNLAQGPKMTVATGRQNPGKPAPRAGGERAPRPQPPPPPPPLTVTSRRRGSSSRRRLLLPFRVLSRAPGALQQRRAG